jgi:hypothetical protein
MKDRNAHEPSASRQGHSYVTDRGTASDRHYFASPSSAFLTAVPFNWFHRFVVHHLLLGCDHWTRSARLMLLLGAFTAMVQGMAQAPIIRVQDNEEGWHEVNQRRQVIEEALVNGEHGLVVQALDGQVVRVKYSGRQDTVPLFSDQERALMLFRMGAYQRVLDDLDRGRHYFSGQGRNRRWISNLISGGLSDVWLNWSPEVLENVAQAIRNPYQREFLQLYWMMMLNDLYIQKGSKYTLANAVFDPTVIQQRVEALLADVPDHPHGDFLRRGKFHGRYELSDWGMDLSMIAGPCVPIRPSNELFFGGSNFSFGLAGTYRRWILTADVLNISSRLRKTWSTGTIVLDQGKHVSMTMLGGSFGHVFMDKGPVRIIPALRFGHGYLTWKDEVDDEIIDLGSLFHPAAEVTFDLRLTQTKAVRDPDLKDGYIVAKIRFGYSPWGFGPSFEPQGGLLYFGIGLGIGSWFVVQR